MIKEATFIDVFAFLEARKYLENLFNHLKLSRKQYSYESYSADLGFARSSYLYQVVAGDRTLTEKAAKTIAESIPLRKVARRYFLALTRHGAAKSAAERHTSFQQILEIRSEVLESELDKRMLQYFSQWYHPVVRELVTLPGFSPDPNWIAANVRPKIKPSEAAESFDLLQGLGFIQYSAKDGAWVQAESVISTSDDVMSLGLMAYHQEMIQRAKNAVFAVPAAERELEAMTFSATPEDFARIKEDLREFRDKLIREYDANGKHDRVLQLNMQLFPLSQAIHGRKAK